MPDGTPFDIPADSPAPAADRRAGHGGRAADRLAVDAGRGAEHARGRRHARQTAPAAMSAARRRSSIRPRRCGSRRRSTSPIRGWPSSCARPPSPAIIGLGIARVLEVRDKHILFDEKFVPPMLICAAHPAIDGWIDRVVGWIDNKLEELARYAADPTAGGGLQSVDYFVLQLLNRHIPVLKHFARSGYVHPERLFDELLAACRRARDLRDAGTPRARLSGLRSRRSRKRLRAGHARPAGFPQRAARPARDPPRDHRARATTPSSRRSATARCSATRPSCSKSRRGRSLTEIQNSSRTSSRSAPTPR